MICIIALIVFSILAIFSAKHRPLAKEAFDCVFRRVTFRPCRSGLDKRLKGQISGLLMKKNVGLGRFVFKYFEIISWIFLIIILLSIFQIGLSVYNYSMYGNCNGADETGFCIFDPLGTAQADITASQACHDGNAPTDNELITPNTFSLVGNPRLGSLDAAVTVVEFGCFACPNTAEQAPAVKKIIEHYGANIQFVYIDFPLDQHSYAYEASLAAECVYKQSPKLYWQYHFLLFEESNHLLNENHEGEYVTEQHFYDWALELGVNEEEFSACIENPETKAIIDADVQLAKESGVYGTPTFFINEQALVGVKSYQLLKNRIDDALKK